MRTKIKYYWPEYNYLKLLNIKFLSRLSTIFLYPHWIVAIFMTQLSFFTLGFACVYGPFKIPIVKASNKRNDFVYT